MLFSALLQTTMMQDFSVFLANRYFVYNKYPPKKISCQRLLPHYIPAAAPGRGRKKHFASLFRVSGTLSLSPLVISSGGLSQSSAVIHALTHSSKTIVYRLQLTSISPSLLVRIDLLFPPKKNNLSHTLLYPRILHKIGEDTSKETLVYR